MLLREMWDHRVTDFVRRGYQDLSKDNSKPDLMGLRQTRLTLAQIKQLRKWTDARNADYRHKLAQLKKQYIHIDKKDLI